jgi:nucleoside-diphosphate-sugar epimerase
MIVITGADGRLGQAIIQKLDQSNTPYRGLCRKNTPKLTTVDYSDRAQLVAAFKGATHIFHLAGGIRGSGQNTPDVINHQLTKLISKAAAQLPTPPTLLMISSTAVYGDRSNLWVDEDMKPTPSSRYGHSKLAAEKACIESGLPTQIIRMGTLYGSGVPFLMIKGLQKKDKWLPGEGRNYIPMIHLDDAAAGILHIANSLPAGEIVHLSDESPMLLQEFYSQVVEKGNLSFRVRFWSTWVPSYIQRYLAKNNERLQSRLGKYPVWTPDFLSLYTSSVRVQTTKLREELGFQCQYPTATEGLDSIFRP